MFHIRWVFKNIDVKHRRLFMAGIVISVVVSCTILINPYLTSLLVDNVIIGKNAQPLIPLLAAMMAVQVVRLGLRYAMQIMLEKSSQQMINTLRRRLFKTLQHQENSFFNRNRTGDLMTRMTGDLDVCRHFVCNLTHQTVDTVLLFTSTLIFLLMINWRLTLALVAVTPLLMLVTRMYSKKARPHFIKMRERLTEMNIAAQENIAGNRIVKAFAREAYEREKFEQRNRNFRNANLDINRLWLKFYPVIEILANFMTLITMLIGGIFIINGSLTAGELSIFTSLTWALANPMRSLGTLINDYQRFFTSANKVIEIYYSRPLIVDRLDAAEQDLPKGNIKFSNVCLKFGNRTILDDVSFEVKPGSTLAIIGPTGSGKTMLINLLTRSYDVTSGEVLLDGCNVKQWKLEQLRRSIGVATQDIFLFSDTIEGNIAFGNQQLSECEVVDFADLAAADEFTDKMPEGYDTIIGERGVGLSGGQKQRIALARALAVRPAVLVLDDTTSALDLETEKYIQSRIDKLPFECTKIIIAQRISSVKNADEIIVLEHGRITERGTHQQLIEQRGYYWETFAIQNDIPIESPATQGGVR